MFEIIVHISSHIHYITYYHDISTAIYLQKPGSQKDPSFVSLKSILICQKKMGAHFCTPTKLLDQINSRI